MKRGKFTTLYDSFGTPIHEGDKIEYFDWCYANKGRYEEDSILTRELNKLPQGFIERAKEKGYVAEHRYKSIYGVDCIEMYKPCKGIVKWNSKFVTYKPVIYSEDDYNNNSFHYVINHCGNKTAYCKVIK